MHSRGLKLFTSGLNLHRSNASSWQPAPAAASATHFQALGVELFIKCLRRLWHVASNISGMSRHPSTVRPAREGKAPTHLHDRYTALLSGLPMFFTLITLQANRWYLCLYTDRFTFFSSTRKPKTLKKNKQVAFGQIRNPGP